MNLRFILENEKKPRKAKNFVLIYGLGGFMDLYIKVAIPQELKEEWVRDKHLSLACEEGRNAFLIKGETAKIEKALADENITKLLELVQNKTRFSSYHEYVEEIGFLKIYLSG